MFESKNNLLKFALIAMVAVSLVASFVTIYSDDEPAFDLLCSNIDFLLYSRLLSDSASCKGIYYECKNVSIYPDILTASLARNEKSPPHSSIQYQLS